MVNWNSIVESLHSDRRRVIADWRLALYARRISANQPNLHAWNSRRSIRNWVAQGKLQPITGISGVYTVEVPYASFVPISEHAVLAESHPWCALSHLSAAAMHGLTNLIPREITATSFPHPSPRLPIGTTPEDWMSAPPPTRRFPSTIISTRVSWTRRTGPEFGLTLFPLGASVVYATDLERTLVDSLREPDKFGGILTIVECWVNAAPALSPSRLERYTEILGMPLMRQRIGYLLSIMGYTSPTTDSWRAASTRGGSARLIAAEPFSSSHDPQWNLSINAPDSTLEPLRGLLAR